MLCACTYARLHAGLSIAYFWLSLQVRPGPDPSPSAPQALPDSAAHRLQPQLLRALRRCSAGEASRLFFVLLPLSPSLSSSLLKPPEVTFRFSIMHCVARGKPAPWAGLRSLWHSSRSSFIHSISLHPFLQVHAVPSFRLFVRSFALHSHSFRILCVVFVRTPTR